VAELATTADGVNRDVDGSHVPVAPHQLRDRSCTSYLLLWRPLFAINPFDSILGILLRMSCEWRFLREFPRAILLDQLTMIVGSLGRG